MTFAAPILAAVLAGAVPLTTAREVRALPPAEAARGRPVRLAGVVTHANPHVGDLFLHDGTGGAYLHPFAANAELTAGDRIEVVGRTEAGAFLPAVVPVEVRKVGTGPRPAAVPYDLTRADSARLETEVVAVTGTGQLACDGGGFAALMVRGANGTGVLMVPEPVPPDWSAGLVGRELRFDAVCAATVDPLTRRVTSPPRLFVQSADRVTVVPPAPAAAPPLPPPPHRPPPPPGVPPHHVVLGAAALAAAGYALYRRQLGRRTAAIRAAFEREAAADLSGERRRRLEAVGRLASGIAHDFNNLLTVIRGNAELLRPGLPPDAARMADEVRQAADRAADLTRQLLTFARGGPSGAAPLDLAAALGEAEGLARRAVGGAVRVTAEYAPDLPPVAADRGRLAQVVLNLAANARDAMPGGGELAIRAVRAAGPHGRPVARVTVADTGAGMDEATQARIFEPFFTTKEVGNGTGLGLATVYGIVRDLDGTIGVRSAPGRGTTFTIDLPAAPAGVAPGLDDTPFPGLRAAPRPAAPAAPAPAGAGVLLVDDDAAVRAVSRAALAAAGFAVTPVGRPADALELVRSDPGRFDLLVTDAAMPGMGGPELAAAARAVRPGLRVLVVSGYPRDELPRGDLLGPDDAYLSKPFTPADLAARARQALGG